jgi:hypothetical protein
MKKRHENAPYLFRYGAHNYSKKIFGVAVHPFNHPHGTCHPYFYCSYMCNWFGLESLAHQTFFITIGTIFGLSCLTFWDVISAFFCGSSEISDVYLLSAPCRV